MSDAPAAEAAEFIVTDAAIARIAALRAQEGVPQARLRVAVSGGGCSGYQYGFSFDEDLTGDDRVFGLDGVEVVIDETSLELLAGAQLDYVQDLIGASFQIRNPNATSSCGCGASFAV